MTGTADIVMRLRQRPALALAVLVLVAAMGGALASIERYSAVKRQAALKKEELSSFRALEAAYLGKKAGIEEALRKAHAKVDQPAIAVIERAADAVGARSSIVSIKQAGEKETLGYTEAGIEVKLERVDLNQLVNLLHHLERGGALVVTREFSMKTRFDAPELYDVDMRLSHVRKKPGA
ncbi:MAG: hypothetical protein QY316_12170 [Thermodesulfobacteriota bacterium]|nr:MAG: hypothetical protein QY316_12170 [Thermodesulfobacteriota bacterium]